MAAQHSITPPVSSSSQLWYINSAELKQMAFPRAAEVWLATRTPYISTKTFHEYELNVRTLSAFFAGAKLVDIGADQIRAYQHMRAETCGPSMINHECSVLQQMLKRVGLWEKIGPQYEPMPLPKEGPGRVLSPEERNSLFDVARTNSEWEAAFLFAMISINTTGGPKEIATLRLKDVELANQLIHVQVEGAKNEGRVRSIPLNDEALKAATLAVTRAKKLGAFSPEHYVFPFRINRSLFDPTRHQTTSKQPGNG
jgi:integrase